ncbi:MAG: 50S ribosomal protein L19 [Patescibacteria group bacterium]|jgi:large subunit ribosomal protein L19
MTTKTSANTSAAGYPEVRPGMTIRVHQKIKEKNTKGEEKERVQVFEGMVIARKHGLEKGATITVRKVSEGVGVERVYPVYSPNIVKIELKKIAQVRRAKLDYLKTYKKKLKEKIVK